MWLWLRFGTLDVRALLPVLSVSMRLQANHVIGFPNCAVALGAPCHSILGLHPLTGIKEMIFTILIHISPNDHTHVLKAKHAGRVIVWLPVEILASHPDESLRFNSQG